MSNTNTKKFIKLCKKSQSDMKKYLVKWLADVGYKPYASDGYILAEGSLPVCLTAHMDTVHKELVKQVVIGDNGNKISSPQGIGGDDRCGIFMIQRIIEAGYKPTVLFCEDEEIGGIGSDKFCLSEYSGKLKEMKFFIELDRAHSKDLVYYHDDNKEFHKWCAKVTGYKEDRGSFSDISNLCPHCGVAGVNISCGYYQAHTTLEYVLMDEMLASIEATKKLLDKANEVEQFKYVEKKYAYPYGNYYGNYYYSDYFNNSYNNYMRNRYASSKKTRSTTWYAIGAYTGKTGDVFDYIDAQSEMEAIGIFMSEHPTLTYGDIYESYECGGKGYIDDDDDDDYSDYLNRIRAAQSTMTTNTTLTKSGKAVNT